MADRRGWPDRRHLHRRRRSAYSGKHRPEYRRMLDDMRAGTVDAVVVWHLDRLHRQPRELEEFFEVCDGAGVRSMASVTGDTDLATHDGRFLARILGAVARKESDDKSRRIKRKHEEMARSGRLDRGGTRPFGYRADRRTRRSRRGRRRCARLSRECSLATACAAIATDWNDARHPHRRVAARWTIAGPPPDARTRAGSAASASYKGEIVARGDWEAIITPEDTARLRAILDGATRRDRPGPSAATSCSGGLLRCGAVRRGPRRPAARRRRPAATSAPRARDCPAAAGSAIIAEPVEAFIAEAVLYRLDTPELAAALDGAQRRARMTSGERRERSPARPRAARRARQRLRRPARSRSPSASRPGSRSRRASTPPSAQLSRLTRTDRDRRPTSATAASLRDGLDGPAAHPSAGDRGRRSSIGSSVRPAVRGRNRFDPDRARARLAASDRSRTAADPVRTAGSVDLHRAAPARRTSARPTRRTVSASDAVTSHDAHTAGGPVQSSSSARPPQIPSGAVAHDRCPPGRGPRPAVVPSSAIRRGWKPWATSYRWSPAGRRPSPRSLPTYFARYRAASRASPSVAEPTGQVAEQLDVDEPVAPGLLGSAT